MFFFRSNNPRHVAASDTLSISITTSLIFSIPTLYHTQIKFSTVCTFDSVPTIPDQNIKCHALTVHISLPSVITWISFDSVNNFLATVLLRQNYHDIQHLIYKSDRLSFSFANKIFPDDTIYLTILINIQAKVTLN